jgi:hypothetical protein
LKRLRKLLKKAPFFEAAGAVAKNCSSLKSNHCKQILLAQIGELHFNINKKEV